MNKRRNWTAIEVQVLREFYADTLTSDIARALGRPVERVHAKARGLGLAKSKDFIAEIARERSLRPDHGGRRHQFQKGQVPANKGVKRPPGWAPGRMAETQFKPGKMPCTWLPVGSYTVRDGVLCQKVADEPGMKQVERWLPVHRLVWTATHGQVPEGHVVAFREGMHTAELELITLDRLELISRAELMARNTIHRMPPELAAVSRLRANLTRAIGQREKEQGK